MSQHSYGLDWIDEDKLFEVTKASFSKVLFPKSRKPLPPDPFTIVAHAVIAQGSLQRARAFEEERAINKTISGNVGYWHQRVLGLAEHWSETGATGGSIDLKTEPGYLHPSHDKPIYVEVKNRFNTIKASDEKNLWDSLDSLSRSNSAVCYVFQIVPKSPDRYDRPWAVSGRTPKEAVRACDGATGYELVFGRPTALRELYSALPKILADITGMPVPIGQQDMDSLFDESMPS